MAISAALYAVGRFLEVFALFVAANFLQNYAVPLWAYSFVVLLASALAFVLIHRSWRGFSTKLSRQQVRRNVVVPAGDLLAFRVRAPRCWSTARCLCSPWLCSISV